MSGTKIRCRNHHSSSEQDVVGDLDGAAAAGGAKSEKERPKASIQSILVETSSDATVTSIYR